MKVADSVTIRTGACLNEALTEGFPEQWEFDLEWVWIAEKDGEQIGCILGAPCHGVAYMIMVKSIKEHDWVVGPLLRRFFKDCMGRGFKGYMVHFNRDNPGQYKLKRIAEKAGAVILPYRIIAAAGRLIDAARW